ncbi:conserved hypothetical protein [Histoplasma capsulatum var. duboisii H88]|uniref:Uncharacterized protein n=2 Tax=Ajellomyces capsulatus TaxID=5037 RepID=F0UCZ6_AJEC8|nr:conserved hypothetical protein [Histoplasma capsulatum H143]EGC43422.1 conserved hypothetical protein [Histoplasma capsulatum var. duboisii H88]
MNPGRQLRVSQPGRQPRVARGQSAAGLAPCGIVGEIWGDVGMLGCVDLGERWQMGDGRLCTLPTRDITATDVAASLSLAARARDTRPLGSGSLLSAVAGFSRSVV